MLIRYARVRTQGKDLEPLQGALASLYLSRLTANGCSLPITTDCFWPKAVGRERQLPANIRPTNVFAILVSIHLADDGLAEALGCPHLSCEPL